MVQRKNCEVKANDKNFYVLDLSERYFVQNDDYPSVFIG